MQWKIKQHVNVSKSKLLMNKEKNYNAMENKAAC
jgi:hypothetical protein